MTRKIGANTWIWTSPLKDEGLERLAPKVRDRGFDVIELPVEQPEDWNPGRAARLLSDLGLKATVVLVMSPGRELVQSDAKTVRTTQSYLRKVVDVAHEVGSPVIAGPAYASVGRTWRMTEAERQDAYEEWRENLLPVVEHAKAAGVTVAVEPLNRYETSFLNTVEQGMDALDGLPEEGCGLALDVYHMNIEERDIPEAVLFAEDRVAHVQVSANDRGAPGADHLDWKGILAALDEVGYTGPLVIESFTAENEGIAKAASIWRELAETQDALAGEGLDFLRGLT